MGQAEGLPSAGPNRPNPSQNLANRQRRKLASSKLMYDELGSFREAAYRRQLYLPDLPFGQWPSATAPGESKPRALPSGSEGSSRENQGRSAKPRPPKQSEIHSALPSRRTTCLEVERGPSRPSVSDSLAGQPANLPFISACGHAPQTPHSALRTPNPDSLRIPRSS